ncbi:MAG: NOB1 family endonuclease [Methanotrichaceae archaeon]
MCALIIADSSVFIYGKTLAGEVVTVPGVELELKDIRSRMRFQIAEVRIERPSKEALDRAERAARETGDLSTLSSVDLDLLAVALELEVPLATDDYALQNVALHLGLRVEPVAQPLIKKVIKRAKRCVGCGQSFQGEECPVCGTPARRKRRRGV